MVYMLNDDQRDVLFEFIGAHYGRSYWILNTTLEYFIFVNIMEDISFIHSSSSGNSICSTFYV